jgi:hypothetical protein
MILQCDTDRQTLYAIFKDFSQKYSTIYTWRFFTVSQAGLGYMLLVVVSQSNEFIAILAGKRFVSYAGMDVA